MPITPYSRPQSTITQILRATAPRIANRRNTIVIGPQYKLLINDGRELPKHEFKSAGEEIPYQELVNGAPAPIDETLYTPVPASVDLYGELLEALVTPIAIAAFQRVGTTTNVLRLTTNNVSGAPLNDGLDGRSVSVGDIFRTTSTNTDLTTFVKRRKVVSLLPRQSASVISDVTRDPANSVGSADLLITPSGTYTGTLHRTYVLDCTIGGADLTVARFAFVDTAGIEPPATIALSATPTPIGNDGVLVAGTMAAGPLVVGDKFYITLTPAAIVPKQFDGVVLDGPILDPVNFNSATPISVNILQEYSGPITDQMSPTGDAFTSDADGVVYTAGLGLTNTDTRRITAGISPFIDKEGDVITSYKAIVLPGLTEPPIYVDSAADCEAKLGEINSTENDLGRGAYEALTGTQMERVYALRTAGESPADFALALRKIQTTDIYYAIAVMSNDPDVSQLVADHCTLMSDKFHKNFRRCYTGVDSPGKYVHWTTLDTGGLRRATIQSGLVTVREEDRAFSNFLTEAAVGDTIQFVGVAAVLPITAVLSNGYEVLVKAPDGLDIATETGFTLTRADTPANTVKFLQDAAARLTNRRAVIVWCDNGMDGSTPIPNRFIAAQISGLRTALLPQQSLTLTEVSTITTAPSMYTRFTPEQLDDIAAAGIMIVTQESDGGAIFIRHQLTTEVEEGSLAYEDNVGVVVDAFSYMVKDEFRDDIGKTNVTSDQRENIEVRYKQLAMNACKSTLANPGVGPLVVTFFNEDGVEGEVTVRQDADLADTFITYISLRVPSPLNGLHHYIDVEVASAV